MLVTCPLTQVKAGDDCIQIVKSLKEATLDYRLKIRNIAEQHFQEVENLFRAVFPLRHPESFVCQMSIGAKRSDSLGTYHLALVFLRVMEDVEIEKEIEAFKDTVDYLNKINPTMHFEKHFPDRLSNFTENEYALVLTDTNIYHESCKPPFIAITDLQICYGVLLKPFQNLEDGAILTKNIVLNRGEYVLQVTKDNRTTSVYTCLSTYLSRVTGQPTEVANPFSNVNKMRSRASSLDMSSCLVMMLLASNVAVKVKTI